MEKKKSKNRMWISLNLISFILLLVFYYMAKNNQWQQNFMIGSAFALLLFVISVYAGFIKTNFWKMVHSKSKNLDEREFSVVLKAIKFSYSIFAILCIVLIYGLAFTQFLLVDVVLGAGLLYLAHILPAVVVGWNEAF
jgi:mannose/fructose/N-acetylgalactosamine-specific phosphotransferase system component IIC